MNVDEVQDELDEVEASLAAIDLGYAQVSRSDEQRLREKRIELQRQLQHLEGCDDE